MIKFLKKLLDRLSLRLNINFLLSISQYKFLLFLKKLLKNIYNIPKIFQIVIKVENILGITNCCDFVINYRYIIS